MNFLAHLLIGDNGEQMLLGSHAGDFVRGRIDRHDARLRAGLRLHRLVDSWAEGHVSYSFLRRQLSPQVGKYAPVAADMLIDHELARTWGRWSAEETLPAFEERVGGVLLGRLDWLPPEAQRVTRMMAEGRWLSSYATESGVTSAMERMSRRLRWPVKLERSIDVLRGTRRDLEDAISEFLCDLFRDQRLLDSGMRAGLAEKEI
jgi:acyl carrier protein phosphodiesterase